MPICREGKPSRCSRQASPNLLLLLLSIGAFVTATAMLMLAPLLVELANEFDTSVAVVGQLGGAIAITWGIVAPLAGPVSDTYGRRRLLLTGLMLLGMGILRSGIAWNYGSLLAFRLLTGVGAATIAPNSIAVIADIFPAEDRGKALGWLLTGGGISTAIGIAMVAFLLDVGGWRMPFYVIGAVTLALWLLLWIWFPRSQRQPGQPLKLLSHHREAGSSATFWYVLGVNLLLRMTFIGVFGYLAANLI